MDVVLVFIIDFEQILAHRISCKKLSVRFCESILKYQFLNPVVKIRSNKKLIKKVLLLHSLYNKVFLYQIL